MARRARVTFAGSFLLLLGMATPARASTGWLDHGYGTNGSVALPLPQGRTENALHLVHGWNGGVVAITSANIDSAGAPGCQIATRARSRTSTGARDTAFAGGNPINIGSGDNCGPIFAVVYDAVMRSDLFVFTGTFDPEIGGATGHGSARVRRITRAGQFVGPYESAQGSGLALTFDTNPRMAVLADRSARICFYPDHDESDPQRIDMLALTPGGERDTSFGPNGIKQNIVPGLKSCNALTVDASNRVLIAGTDEVGARGTLMLARMSSAGVLDASFGTNGVTQLMTNMRKYDAPYIAIYPDNSFYVGGQVDVYDNASNVISALPYIARFYSNGHIVPSFGYGGVYRYNLFTGASLLTALTFTTDRRLLATFAPESAQTEWYRGVLLRLNGYTAKRDTSFGSNGQIEEPGPTPGVLTDSARRIVTESSHWYLRGQFDRRAQIILQRRTQ